MRKLMNVIVALYMVASVATPAQATASHASLDSLIRAVRQNPNDLSLRRDMAKAMIANGQTVKAAEQIQLMINAGSNTAEDWTTLGEALRFSAKYPQAIEAYTHSLKINPLSSQALGGMAMAYASAGQYVRALSIVRTGLSQTSDEQGRRYLTSTLASIQNMTSIASASVGSIAR
jgi:cytochrome c-type biogenesis protein CcmH/NrfG